MDIDKKRDAHIDRETLRIFLRVIAGHRKLFALTILFLVSKILINILLPLLISLTFARMVSGGNTEEYISWLALVAAAGVVTNYIGMKALMKLSAAGQRDLTNMTFEMLLGRSVGFHANSIAGKLVSNALDFPSSYGRLLDAAYVQLIPLALILISGIIVVAVAAPILALALFLVISIVLSLSVLDSQWRKKLRYTRRKVQNRMIAHFSDTVVNASAVKTFAREIDETAANHRVSTALMRHRSKDWTRSVKSGTARMGTLLALQIALIAFIAHLYAQDPAVLGIGIFAFVYTITLTNRLFDISNLIMTVEESFLDASSMTQIFMQATEITDKASAHKLTVTSGRITLQDVRFSYPDDDSNDAVFEKLSLDIVPGQKVGLVGPSGGGKSTLTRLLLRFDDVTDGAISIDEQDLREVTQKSLRSQIAYVPQEPLLFHRSIFENIAYGKPDATLAEVKHAAKLAYADDFIEQLPGGYKTIVGERGVKLSGGQRQRVAIARAILKNAPILILDEATSALDSESEVYIQKALTELMQGRTTIVIAHRLSTIQKLDRILVLDEGHIKEDGTHSQLLKEDKLYAKLWAHQSGGFIDE